MDAILELISVRLILLLVALPIIVYRVLTWIYWRSSKNYPPGPYEWGSTWKIAIATWNGTLPMLATEWAKKYGPLTFFYGIGQPVLLLNSAEVTRQMLSSEKYKLMVADRLAIAGGIVAAQFNGKDLIFTNYDDMMKKKRRMFFNVLGLYGDGVTKFEDVVWREMENMFATIDKCQGQDADIINILGRSLKVIFYILAIGELPKDANVPDILEEFDLQLNKLTTADLSLLMDRFPFITKISGKIKNTVKRVINAKKKVDEIMYFDAKKTHVPNEPRGITDLLIDHQKRPGNEWMDNDEEHILAMLSSLFFAAHLTSRASLTGTLLCLLNYPKVAQKIKEEVDRVIGDKRPRIENKSSMPYTEAIILEGLRLIAQVPLSGFRKSCQDFEFEGMFIPKDTTIYMNNWYYLRDEKIYEDPWAFKPERFLDSEGQLLPSDHPLRKALIAFGVGPRSCPGEIFARSRVFLFLTCIVQRYDLLPPTTEKLPPADFQIHDESIQGIIRQTIPYKCRLIRRKKVEE